MEGAIGNAKKSACLCVVSVLAIALEQSQCRDEVSLL